MAYLRQSTTVASAVCKQSTTTGRLTPSVFSAQTCSRFSTLSSSAQPVFCKFGLTLWLQLIVPLFV